MNAAAHDAQWRPRRRRGVVLRHDAVRDTALVLQPERLAKLNPTAARILELCDGTRDAGMVVDVLHADYPDAARDDVAASVGRFLAAATAEGWLE